MSIQEEIQAERERRSLMWDAVKSIQQERPLTADEVHEIGCYKGARGIWRDKTSTSHLTESGNGVCVGISSRGKYEDEIGEETGTYDYPSTYKSQQSSLVTGIDHHEFRNGNRDT